jgi:hypothetical protein
LHATAAFSPRFQAPPQRQPHRHATVAIEKWSADLAAQRCAAFRKASKNAALHSLARRRGASESCCSFFTALGEQFLIHLPNQSIPHAPENGKPLLVSSSDFRWIIEAPMKKLVCSRKDRALLTGVVAHGDDVGDVLP